jgi:hypothetical protein
VRLLLAPGTDPDEVLIGLTPARRLALTNARLDRGCAGPAG